MATPQLSDYQLSCEIIGHSADVRAVQSLQLPTDEHILTASRDGTACVWVPEKASKRTYIQQQVLKQHTGYVSALCVVPGGTSAVGRHGRKFVTCVGGGGGVTPIGAVYIQCRYNRGQDVIKQSKHF